MRLNRAAAAAVERSMDATTYVEPLSCEASAVFKRRGRWYASVPCPICESPLRVRLSLGPMVARCEACREDVEADVTGILTSGRA